ncbi:MAG: ribonucleoside-diphosphate reductase subunit beta [Candidatus Mesenet longicola]|nr:MAG: ribonucleoside-diphosphate reductase subunit beta [Candidatus Mesenet longicola]
MTIGNFNLIDNKPYEIKIIFLYTDMSLLDAAPIYKPFNYPWAYDAWLQQQRIHWLPEEVPLADDVKDWKTKLSEVEKNLLTQIFRFFTQADIEVNNCYMKHYANIFKPTEILMMLASFSNIETIHIAAYSYLLDTIGIPESEYEAFLKYDAMRKKYEYMLEFEESQKGNKKHVAKTLAVFGAFTEGLQLFASFAILLNFQRFGKMKGMGQIIAWSARDETLHTNSIITLFNTFIRENSEIWNDEFKEELYSACRSIVGLEDEFIKLAFALGNVEGLSKEEVMQYIRYIADRRLLQLGLEQIYRIEKNPLPWLDEILNGVEHTNFFENRVTEYSRASTEGTWEEAFADAHDGDVK